MKICKGINNILKETTNMLADSNFMATCSICVQVPCDVFKHVNKSYAIVVIITFEIMQENENASTFLMQY